MWTRREGMERVRDTETSGSARVKGQRRSKPARRSLLGRPRRGQQPQQTARQACECDGSCFAAVRCLSRNPARESREREKHNKEVQRHAHENEAGGRWGEGTRESGREQERARESKREQERAGKRRRERKTELDLVAIRVERVTI